MAAAAAAAIRVGPVGHHRQHLIMLPVVVVARITRAPIKLIPVAFKVATAR